MRTRFTDVGGARFRISLVPVEVVILALSIWYCVVSFVLMGASILISAELCREQSTTQARNRPSLPNPSYRYGQVHWR